jgi:hypothetical protein
MIRQALGEGAAIGRAKNAAIRFALSMTGRPHFESGGIVGPLNSIHGGRTDTLPVSVPGGSYVIPADIVSGMPGAEGNTLAGHTMLGRLFGSPPFSPDKGPWGVKPPDLAHGHTMPWHMHQGMPRLPHANGGPMGNSGGTVDIMAAGGEYIVHPNVVRWYGAGNLELGHEIIDKFVKRVRAMNIAALKKLPGPVKNG